MHASKRLYDDEVSNNLVLWNVRCGDRLNMIKGERFERDSWWI